MFLPKFYFLLTWFSSCLWRHTALSRCPRLRARWAVCMIPTPSHSPRAPPNSAHGHHHHHHTLASSCRSPDSRMMKDGLTACVSVTKAVGARASSMLPPTLESSLGAEIDHDQLWPKLAPPLDGVYEPGGGAGGVAGGAAGGLGHTRHQVRHLLLHGLVT